jgi:hypothetical protein
MIANSRNRESGGVAVDYRSILNVINREDLIQDNIEAICPEVIKPKSKPILITSVYRPPSSRIEYFEKIEILFQNLDSEHKELIIIGDFKRDLLKNNLFIYLFIYITSPFIYIIQYNTKSIQYNTKNKKVQFNIRQYSIYIVQYSTIHTVRWLGHHNS